MMRVLVPRPRVGIPSLKFLGLLVHTILRIYCVSIGLVTLTLKLVRAIARGVDREVEPGGYMKNRLRDAIPVPVHVMQCLYGLTINQFR